MLNATKSVGLVFLFIGIGLLLARIFIEEDVFIVLGVGTSFLGIYAIAMSTERYVKGQTNQVIFGMTGWIIFSWLLVLLAHNSQVLNQLSILATVVTIGLLISAEMVSGYGTRSLRKKISIFAYAGFILFLVIFIVRVIDILRG